MLADFGPIQVGVFQDRQYFSFRAWKFFFALTGKPVITVYATLGLYSLEMYLLSVDWLNDWFIEIGGYGTHKDKGDYNYTFKFWANAFWINFVELYCNRSWPKPGDKKYYKKYLGDEWLND